MRVSKVTGKRGVGVCVLALSAATFALTSCAQDEAPTSSTESKASRVIYWTDTESASNDVILRSTTITDAQARWLIDTRRGLQTKRLDPTRLPAVPPDDISVTRSAVTVGSTSWSDCVSYEWFLVTSGSDFSGDFFCAKFQTPTNSGSAIQMPFLPAYFDSAASSTAVFNLCTSSSNCAWFDCCGDSGGCGSIWHTYFQSSGSGNISPPGSVQFIRAQSPIAPC